MKKFLKTLGVAIATGALNGFVQSASDGKPITMKNVGMGAAIGAATYVLKSPWTQDEPKPRKKKKAAPKNDAPNVAP